LIDRGVAYALQMLLEGTVATIQK